MDRDMFLGSFFPFVRSSLRWSLTLKDKVWQVNQSGRRMPWRLWMAYLVWGNRLQMNCWCKPNFITTPSDRSISHNANKYMMLRLINLRLIYKERKNNELANNRKGRSISVHEPSVFLSSQEFGTPYHRTTLCSWPQVTQLRLDVTSTLTAFSLPLPPPPRMHPDSYEKLSLY